MLPQTSHLPWEVTHHQPWRVVTAMLLHGGVLHIACNGMSLLTLGMFIEELFGPARFWVVFTLTGDMEVTGIAGCAGREPGEQRDGRDGDQLAHACDGVLESSLTPQTLPATPFDFTGPREPAGGPRRPRAGSPGRRSYAP